jgi:hypothetical protein
MGTFRPEELVTIQGRPFPTLAGRLRLLHEGCEKIAIKTEVVHLVLGQEAVVRTELTTGKGTFVATGSASATRDPRFVDALPELAESRSLARAARWAGFGLEVGAEELGDDAEIVRVDRAGPLQGRPRVAQGQVVASAPFRGNGDGSHRGTPATSAQRRAIAALARQIDREVDEVVARVYPGVTVDGLTLVQASALIDRLKTKAGNGAGTGR